MIKETNEKNFDKNNTGKVLVDFSASWCGPCKMLGIVLEKVEKELDIPILKIDIDESPNLADKYGIRVVPTLILFENKEEIKRITGFMTKDELESWVNNNEK